MANFKLHYDDNSGFFPFVAQKASLFPYLIDPTQWDYSGYAMQMKLSLYDAMRIYWRLKSYDYDIKLTIADRPPLVYAAKGTANIIKTPTERVVYYSPQFSADLFQYMINGSPPAWFDFRTFFDLQVVHMSGVQTIFNPDTGQPLNMPCFFGFMPNQTLTGGPFDSMATFIDDTDDVNYYMGFVAFIPGFLDEVNDINSAVTTSQQAYQRGAAAPQIGNIVMDIDGIPTINIPMYQQNAAGPNADPGDYSLEFTIKNCQFYDLPTQ